MRRSLPPLNQRRRWYVFWAIMFGMIGPFVAKYLPEDIGAGLFAISFVWVMAAASVLAFWPKPANPWE